jgi:hypothetical protein
MTVAVDLEGQTSGQADEIENERARRMLPAKLESARALPQLQP